MKLLLRSPAMQKRCISAPDGPPAAGPYSHACAAGNLLFVSGQAALAPDGSGPIRGTIQEETRQTLSNLRAILENSGSSLAQVVKVNAYLADMADFAAFNEVYKEFFTADYPARTTIQAAGLPLNFKVEVEAIAVLP
jgi:2-iminobutanoate/2-iminopropanoate deaminase